MPSLTALRFLTFALALTSYKAYAAEKNFIRDTLTPIPTQERICVSSTYLSVQQQFTSLAKDVVSSDAMDQNRALATMKKNLASVSIAGCPKSFKKYWFAFLQSQDEAISRTSGVTAAQMFTQDKGARAKAFADQSLVKWKQSAMALETQALQFLATAK